MRVLYRPAAIADIQRAADYLAQVLKNPGAAQRLKEAVVRGAAQLKDNPHMGVPLASKAEGLETPMRFLVIRKQLVFYEVRGDAVEIVRVLDGRTDYLARLFESENE